MDYRAIIFERKDGIAYLTLNRPEVLNARNRQMREELIDAVTAIRADPEVRVVILTGAGSGRSRRAEISRRRPRRRSAWWRPGRRRWRSAIPR